MSAPQMSELSNGEGDALEVDEKVIQDVGKHLRLESCRLDLGEKIGKGENYLSIISRGVIQGRSAVGDHQETHQVIVKFCHRSPRVRAHFSSMRRLYAREIFMYNTFLPTLDRFQKERNIPESEHFKFVQLYASDMEENNEVLIFEDMNAKDYTMHDRLLALNYEHVVLIIKSLARYHALSFAAKDRIPELYKEAETHVLRLTDYGDNFKESLTRVTKYTVNHLVDPGCRERFSKFGETIYEKLGQVLDLESDDCPYNVFCHGDCWSNNFLFKYEGAQPVDMVVLDWQLCRLASPVTDLTYFIYTGTDRAFREEHLEGIYNIYYQSLANHLEKLDVDVNKCYPEYIFRQDIQHKSIYGLIWCILLFPIILNSKENAVDLDDFAKEKEKNAEPTFKYSEICRERLNEVVEDFVKNGFI